jgi:stearoyl-CoA desaturase (Delta-9 desaturase)
MTEEEPPMLQSRTQDNLVTKPQNLPLDWINISMLAVVHTVAIGGMALYLPLHGLSVAAAVIGLCLSGLTIFSISAGYHRLFAHKTYEAHLVFRAFLLFFGAGAFQNTVLSWASDHRRHHGKTDSDLDPYDARRGFWYSHFGWVLYKADPNLALKQVRDLEKDPLVAFQHKHYVWVGLAAGVVVPTLLGLLFGDPLGGFIVGGAVRLMACYHITFAINSFAHWLGKQPYSDRSSARDSFLVALLSMGEGYHNFHHTFPSDYRNGVRTHQFDPTKWILRTLASLGVVHNLKRTSPAAIYRARLQMDERRLQAAVVPAAERERLQALRAAINTALDRLHELAGQLEAARRQAGDQARELFRRLRAEFRIAQQELTAAYRQWQQALHAHVGPATPAAT